MPRKKTIQPAPLEVHDYGDLIVEIIDKDTRPIGRGQDKVFKASELVTEGLNQVLNMRDSTDPRERVKARNLLEGGRREAELAKRLSRWGYEYDERTLRHYAKAIRKEWQVLRAAMEANNIDPWP